MKPIQPHPTPILQLKQNRVNFHFYDLKKIIFLKSPQLSYASENSVCWLRPFSCESYVCGCLIQTLTLLSILILASVCIILVCAWINLSFLQLNSFSTAFFSLGNEMCSKAPTSFQKCFWTFSLFFKFSRFELLIMESLKAQNCFTIYESC